MARSVTLRPRRLSTRREPSASSKQEPQRREPSPQFKRETSPQIRRETSPQLRRDTSPPVKRENSPGLRRDVATPLRREQSPHRKPDLSSLLKRESSPSQGTRVHSPRSATRVAAAVGDALSRTMPAEALKQGSATSQSARAGRENEVPNIGTSDAKSKDTTRATSPHSGPVAGARFTPVVSSADGQQAAQHSSVSGQQSSQQMQAWRCASSAAARVPRLPMRQPLGSLPVAPNPEIPGAVSSVLRTVVLRRRSLAA